MKRKLPRRRAVWYSAPVEVHVSAWLTSLEVHVGTPIEECQEINGRLLADANQDGGYAEDIFENLVYRYEEPNGMTRWDSPLFTVPSDDETPPFDAIWEALIGSDGSTKTIKPHQATVMVCTRFRILYF